LFSFFLLLLLLGRVVVVLRISRWTQSRSPIKAATASLSLSFPLSAAFTTSHLIWISFCVPQCAPWLVIYVYSHEEKERERRFHPLLFFNSNVYYLCWRALKITPRMYLYYYVQYMYVLLAGISTATRSTAAECQVCSTCVQTSFSLSHSSLFLCV
jgi:hypothetical protein